VPISIVSKISQPAPPMGGGAGQLKGDLMIMKFTWPWRESEPREGEMAPGEAAKD
jgi:hypothetical protein